MKRPRRPVPLLAAGVSVLLVASAPASVDAAPPRRGTPTPRMLPVPSSPPAAAPAPGGVTPPAPEPAAPPLSPPENADLVPLEKVLEHAYERSPAVAVARARVELGDAAIAGNKLLVQYNPEVWLGFGVRRNVNGSTFEFQAQLDQRLEIFGERRLRLRAARRYKEQLKKELARAQWDIYTQVHAAYNNALVAKARAETAAGVVAFSSRLLETAKRRAQAGEISELRVRIAEGEFAQARQRKLAADVDFRIACNRLAEAAGWTKGRVIAPAGELRAPQHVRDVERFVTQALEEHPAIVAQAAAVDAAEARLAAARRDAMPEPMIGAFASSELEPTANAVRTQVGLVTVTIPIPIWQRNQRERAETKAALSIARSELGALEYRLGLQVRRAIEAVNVAADRVRTYASEVVPRFQENLAMLERAFELGEADIIEVFVARERFLSIQSEALEAYNNYYDAILHFEAQTGVAYVDAATLAP